MTTVVLATTNPNKVREIRALLDGVHIEVVGLDRFDGIEPPEETGTTFEENAALKARYYAAATGLDAAGNRDSSARFVCAVALADGDEIRFAARGTVEGRVAPEPQGAHGFGYDPIFFYPPEGRTLAEVSDDTKRAVSHRGAAFRALRHWLEQRA